MADHATTGARWGLIAAAALQLSTVLSTVVPARILSPAEFAIVGVATVVTGLFGLLGEAGFGQALIVSDREDSRRASTSFWFAGAVGTTLALLVAVTSPWTAQLAGFPDVAPYIAVSGITVPLGLAVGVLSAVQLRRFRYRVAFIAQINTAVATAIVPIALAIAGFGAWSLIIGRLVGLVVQIITLLIGGRFVPERAWDGELIRSELGFNGMVLGSAAASYGSKNLDYWVLGNVVTPSAYGAYYVAFVVPSLLRQRATLLMGQVMLPVLSRLSDQPDEQRRTFVETVGTVAMLTVPLLCGVALLAEPLVEVAFGDQWQAAAAPLAILSIAAAIDVLAHASNPLFLARHRPSLMLGLQILRFASLALALIAVPFRPEVTTAAWAVTASVVVGLVGVVVVLGWLGVSAGSLARAAAPALVPTIAMIAVLAAGRSVWSAWPDLVQLVAVGAAGIVIYGAIGLALFRTTFLTLLRRAWSIAVGRRGAVAPEADPA